MPAAFSALIALTNGDSIYTVFPIPSTDGLVRIARDHDKDDLLAFEAAVSVCIQAPCEAIGITSPSCVADIRLDRLDN